MLSACRGGGGDVIFLAIAPGPRERWSHYPLNCRVDRKPRREKRCRLEREAVKLVEQLCDRPCDQQRWALFGNEPSPAKASKQLVHVRSPRLAKIAAVSAAPHGANERSSISGTLKPVLSAHRIESAMSRRWAPSSRRGASRAGSALAHPAQAARFNCGRSRFEARPGRRI